MDEFYSCFSEYVKTASEFERSLSTIDKRVGEFVEQMMKRYSIVLLYFLTIEPEIGGPTRFRRAASGTAT